jgi:hypothetical protein
LLFGMGLAAACLGKPNVASAQFVVTSGAASGPGSLPKAVIDANASGTSSTIQIEVPSIGLNSSLQILSSIQMATSASASQINIGPVGAPYVISFGVNPTNLSIGPGITVNATNVCCAGIYMNTLGSTLTVNGSILAPGPLDGIQTAGAASITVGPSGTVHAGVTAIRELGGIGGLV